MRTKEVFVQMLMKVPSQFMRVVKEDTFEHIDHLLGSKGNEYSREDDRIENFKDGARIEGETPERILWFFMLKHIISVRKFVKELDTDSRRPYNTWIEKIDDIIAYLVILKAMVYRRTIVEGTLNANATRKEPNPDNVSDGDEAQDDIGDYWPEPGRGLEGLEDKDEEGSGNQ